MHSDGLSSLNHIYTNPNVPDPEVEVVPDIEPRDPVGDVTATD